MRIKILLLGDNPVSLLADRRLLRDRGMLVFTAFNLQNINELVAEINPDVVFFDPGMPQGPVTDAYNAFAKNVTHIPIIFTLADDDVYLVTRRKSPFRERERKALIAGNIISAIKMALHSNHTHTKKNDKGTHRTIPIPTVNARA